MKLYSYDPSAFHSFRNKLSDSNISDTHFISREGKIKIMLEFERAKRRHYVEGEIAKY
jgi:hypothetical protein